MRAQQRGADTYSIVNFILTSSSVYLSFRHMIQAYKHITTYWETVCPIRMPILNLF